MRGQMQKSTTNGLKRLWYATLYSIKGLKAAWRNEAAFRQECCVIAVLLPAAIFLGSDALERALLIFSLLLIFVVELINSALESTIDRIGPERHELSGRAKDLGSAAVLLSLIAAAVVWGFIAFERFST
jgi:diacylglycerol kinase (ATP)